MTAPQLALNIALIVALLLFQLTLFAASMCFFLKAITAYITPRTATGTHPIIHAAASFLLTTASFAIAFFSATLLTSTFLTD